MEVITTIAIVLSIVLSYLIYYEHRKTTGEKDSVYILLLIFFSAYFLAENNWLLGREFREGTVVYGIFAIIVFIMALKRTFGLNETVFYLFLIGVVSLGLGTFMDAMNDNLLPFAFKPPNRILLEEIPEIFAALFFLHSMLLLYLHIIKDKCWFILDKAGAAIIITAVIIIGYGNTFLLEDHDQPIPFVRVMFGMIICLAGLFIPLLYFLYFRYKGREKYWQPTNLKK